MFEKVNPSHPDKIADRIAGAIVDIAYETQIDPKVAVEVLIGHGICHAIVETSAMLNLKKVKNAIHRIAGNVKTSLFPRTGTWQGTRKTPFAAAITVSSRVFP